MARSPVPHMLRSGATVERANAAPADSAALCMRSPWSVPVALRVWPMEGLSRDGLRGLQRGDGTEGSLIDAGEAYPLVQGLGRRHAT
jgi:hypothetical protein